VLLCWKWAAGSIVVETKSQMATSDCLLRSTVSNIRKVIPILSLALIGVLGYATPGGGSTTSCSTNPQPQSMTPGVNNCPNCTPDVWHSASCPAVPPGSAGFNCVLTPTVENYQYRFCNQLFGICLCLGNGFGCVSRQQQVTINVLTSSGTVPCVGPAPVSSSIVE